jgi:phage FluMu protein Com
VLQIGCWTVGVNIPPIDTIVILRKIGSLTLLTQLIGRGIRNLKQEHIDAGMNKKDCLVLDYAGTMESIGHLFNDPLLEKAEFERAFRKNEVIDCPRCSTINSTYARRCIGHDARGIEKDGRCGFFWLSKKCESCGTENDQVARSCRECDAQLIDPNANLTGKHYVDADFKDVLGFSMAVTKNQEGLIVKYQLENDDVATEIFYPASENMISRKIFYAEFVAKHLHKSWHARLRGKNAVQILAMKAMFDVPTKITHRVNDKGRSIISRKIFSSGRSE